ncbi:MAG: hypothetical protein NTW71_03565 [Deltaproteobacteria bacterium]|nr:hypothetical protein [Deltaproteobacteria bacterium]
MINPACFKMGMNLKYRVENSDETHQNNKTGREKIHNELQRILEMKGADHGLDAEYEKKDRKKADQNYFSPPDA